MRRGEVEVGQEPGDVGDQRLHGFGILHLVVLDESLDGGLAGGPAVRIHSLVQGPVRLGLESRWELVEHIGDPVHPASLLPGLRPDLADGGPGSQAPHRRSPRPALACRGP